MFVFNLVCQLILVGFFFLKLHSRKDFRIIGYYVTYSFLSTVVINQLIQKVSNNNFLSFRVFTLIEGVLLTAYLYTIIVGKTAKRLLILSTACFLVIVVVDLFKSSSKTFDSLPTVVECLILISFSIIYFYEQLKNTINIFIYNSPHFWIVFAILFFFSGSFFAFIYAQNYSDSPQVALTFSNITSYLTLPENILFLIAFIIARQQSKTIKSNIVAKTT